MSRVFSGSFSSRLFSCSVIIILGCVRVVLSEEQMWKNSVVGSVSVLMCRYSVVFFISFGEVLVMVRNSGENIRISEFMMDSSIVSYMFCLILLLILFMWFVLYSWLMVGCSVCSIFERLMNMFMQIDMFSVSVFRFSVEKCEIMVVLMMLLVMMVSCLISSGYVSCVMWLM